VGPQASCAPVSDHEGCGVTSREDSAQSLGSAQCIGTSPRVVVIARDQRFSRAREKSRPPVLHPHFCNSKVACPPAKASRKGIVIVTAYLYRATNGMLGSFCVRVSRKPSVNTRPNVGNLSILFQEMRYPVDPWKQALAFSFFLTKYVMPFTWRW